MPPSNPATRFQAAAISFSLINLVSRPLYHHWPLLAYLSPRASHFFRFIPFFLFFLSRYRFFFFFLHSFRSTRFVSNIRQDHAHPLDRGIYDRGRNRISYPVLRFILFYYPFLFLVRRGEGMDYAFAWSHYLVHQWSLLPLPSIHPSKRKTRSRSNEISFRSPVYRVIVVLLETRYTLPRWKDIYVCIILDTFRWCFNFPINACLNRISRFGKFIFHAITRRSGILSVFHVRLFPI